MAEHEKELHFTVVYKGKLLQLKALAGSTLGDLGKEIVDLTGVAPHTLRLFLPKRPSLQPMSEQHSTKLLYQSGITEGMKMVMMGSSAVEVAAVSQPLINDRIIGFSEEEQRARQRSGHASGSYALPKGNYIFCDFQTLRLPGIELNPPPALALKIMHKLASDRGITAIMNKYRWRVGIMTEMAPIGYVGISPKCILGFNKNRGQEISLRLRTDDLNGFRKYESIKKTLLHELAHMVHDEHDEKFHALDKKLNEEAIALDWTKSQGHTLSGVRFEDEEEGLEAGSSGSSRGYKLGGQTEQFVDARAAAAAAALRRFGDASKNSSLGESSQRTVIVAQPVVQYEHDPDAQDPESVVVTENRAARKDDDDAAAAAAADDIFVHVPVRNEEQDPDEASHERVEHKEPDPDKESHERVERKEPDPDKESHERVEHKEPDPDKESHERVEHMEPDPEKASSEHGAHKESDPDAMSIVMGAPLRSQEPDPEEAASAPSKNEPGPDEVMETLRGVPERIQEPDPDEAVNNTLDSSLKYHEPDPDEASTTPSKNGSNPDEVMETLTGASERTQEPDRDESGNHILDSSLRHHEPVADEACNGCSCKDEPDPDESVDTVVGSPIRRQEPHLPRPLGGQSSRNEPDPDDAVDIDLDSPIRKHEPDPDEATGGHVCRNEPDPDEPIDIVLDIPVMRQEPDPDEGVQTIETPARDDTVHVHNKSTGDRDECGGCRSIAGKRMKSSTGSGFPELFQSQMSR